MHHGDFSQFARDGTSTGTHAKGRALRTPAHCVILGLLSLSVLTAPAVTWTNSLGGQWAEPLNWSEHLVPTNLDATIGAPGTYVVNLGIDAAVRQLVLDNPTATLGGPAALSVSESFTWRNGVLGGPASGVLVANGSLLMTGAPAGMQRSLARTLINTGSAIWDDPAILALASGAMISNTAAGTFQLSGAGSIDAAGGSGFFANAGVLRKSGSNVTDFGAELRNTGTLRIESGSLNLRQGFQHAGSLEISNLAGLTLSSGNHNFTADSTLTGAGDLTIAGGSVNLGGRVELSGRHVFRAGNIAVTGTFNAITNLLSIEGANVAFSGNFRFISNQLQILSGSARFDGNGTLEPSVLNVGPLGRLEGSTPVVVRGPLTLQASTLAGSGTVVAQDGLTLGGGSLSMSGRTLMNRGAARWGGATAGSISMASGALITNLAGATFDLDLDAIVSDSGGAGGFANDGLFRKTGGAGSSIFTTSFRNNGTLETRAGTLALSGGGTHRGTFQIGADSQLSFGGLQNFTADSVLSGPGTLSVISGTANLAGLVDVSGPHLFSGGVANLTGRYNAITNQIVIAFGTANFSGTGSVTPSSLVISNTGVLGGTSLVTVRGPMKWIFGRIEGSGQVVAEGGLEMIGGALTMSGRTLMNRGAARWGGATAGSLSMASGALITNLAGATFDLDLDTIVSESGGAGGFANDGFFRKTGGAGSSIFTTSFRNNGTLETRAGTLALSGGGTHRGTFQIGADSQLSFGGLQNFTADSVLSGPGTLSVISGTANLAGLVDVSGPHLFSGGVANLTGRYNAITNQIVIAFGTANFSGTGSVTPSSLVISNTGVLGGTSLVTVRGPMKWIFGRIEGSGQVVAEGGLEMIGGALTMSGRTLMNRGAARWGGATAGSLSMASGALITNLAGATFDLDLDTIVSESGGAGGFANDGLFRKTGGAGSSIFTTSFRNNGTLETRAGALALSGGGTHRGTFQIGADSQLSFGGLQNFTADSVLSGPGTLSVISGTANLAGLVDVSGPHLFSGGVANLTGRYNAITNQIVIAFGTANFSGTGSVTPSSLVISNTGVLGGTSLVTVRGPMKWIFGRIEGSGQVVAEGGLEMIGGALTMSGRTLMNRGAARWGGATAGSLAMASGALITNLAGATFDLDLDAIVSDGGGAGGFANAGLFRKTGGSGSTAFTAAFRNSGTMELRVGTMALSGGFTQTAGNLLLRGGQLASSRPVRILGGRMLGSGTVFGSITNAGWIQPGDGPGLLIVDGDYAQDRGGSLEVRLAGTQPVTNHDQLVISNLANLDGTLVATLAEGFDPAPNTTFEILRCKNRTGTFANLQFPSNTVGMTLEYSSSNVLVRVTNTRPLVDPIPDQTVDATGVLSLTVVARDADLPPQTLRYSLTNAPAGATIDGQGTLRWTATTLPSGASTNITVVVTDSGTPNLSASRTFLVRAGTQPGLSAVSLQFGVPAPGANTLTFRGIPSSTYHAEYGLSVLGPWFEFSTATAGADGVWSVVDPSATNVSRFYRAR
jgi:hypothetical protein